MGPDPMLIPFVFAAFVAIVGVIAYAIDRRQTKHRRHESR